MARHQRWRLSFPPLLEYPFQFWRVCPIHSEYGHPLEFYRNPCKIQLVETLSKLQFWKSNIGFMEKAGFWLFFRKPVSFEPRFYAGGVFKLAQFTVFRSVFDGHRY
jgi:hypothetical protein